jgi:hypothetical protein
MADKNKSIFDVFKKKPSSGNGYDASPNKAIPKSVSAFRDILNGGGAGMEGPRFEGGALSGLLNTIGIKPLGYYDRAANYKAPLTSGQASRQAVSESVNPSLEKQLARRANLGPFDPRVSTGQVDWGDNAFGPLTSMGMNPLLAIDPFGIGNLTPAGAMTGPMNPPRADAEMMATELPFQPYIPPYRTDVMPNTINPVEVPFSNAGSNRASGALGAKPSSIASYRNSAKIPPKGMSELAYTNWLRNNSGVLNVDKMTPDGLRGFYQNYLNIQ